MARQERSPRRARLASARQAGQDAPGWPRGREGGARAGIAPVLLEDADDVVNVHYFIAAPMTTQEAPGGEGIPSTRVEASFPALEDAPLLPDARRADAQADGYYTNLDELAPAEFDSDLETAAADAGETLDEDVATVFVTAWEPEALGDDDGYVYSYSYGAGPSGGSSSDDDANAAIIGGSVAAVAIVLQELQSKWPRKTAQARAQAACDKLVREVLLSGRCSDNVTAVLVLLQDFS